MSVQLFVQTVSWMLFWCTSALSAPGVLSGSGRWSCAHAIGDTNSAASTRARIILAATAVVACEPRGRVFDLRAVRCSERHSRRLVDLRNGTLAVDFDLLNKGDAVLGEILCTSADGSNLVAKICRRDEGLNTEERPDKGTVVDDVFFPGQGTIGVGAASWAMARVAIDLYTNNAHWLKVLGASVLTLAFVALALLSAFSLYLGITRRMPRKYDSLLKGGPFPVADRAGG